VSPPEKQGWLHGEWAGLIALVLAIGVVGTYIGAHGRGGRRANDAPGDDRRSARDDV
jgi:hypothetical protein